MTELEQIGGDLRFVRGALASSERPQSPAALYFFWAAAVLVGFALVDFRQALVGPYWAVTGPAGFVASAYMGWRHARHTGQVSAADGRRHLLHWGGMLLAIALALLMPSRGVLSWEALNSVILLILAFLLTDVSPYYESLFLFGAVTFLLLYILFLIEDLDNPFSYNSRFSGSRVSRKHLRDTLARIELEIQAMDALEAPPTELEITAAAR